jgi:hypothetical protein
MRLFLYILHAIYQPYTKAMSKTRPEHKTEST